MLSVKGDLYPCIQYSGCGLFRYLICFATHTLVSQCQYISKKELSHFSILIDINRFHPYFNYSPTVYYYFFLIYSSIYLPSYHTSSLFMIYYAAPPVLPRLLAQALARTFNLSFLILFRNFEFIFFRQLGQTFVHCPIFPTAAIGSISFL